MGVRAEGDGGSFPLGERSQQILSEDDDQKGKGKGKGKGKVKDKDKSKSKSKGNRDVR